MSDLIRREDAIKRATEEHDFYIGASLPTDKARRDELLNVMCWLNELPSAEPEDSIPISWIEKEIDWLNNTDNCFANLTATNISAMVKRWKEEKDG